MSDGPASEASYWAEPVGRDGVVRWGFGGEYPCGFAYAVNPSRMGGGRAVGEVVNLHSPGVHVIKADWVADQGWKSHDDLCGCDLEPVTENGKSWMETVEFEATTVTLTKVRYEELLAAEGLVIPGGEDS